MNDLVRSLRGTLLGQRVEVQRAGETVLVSGGEPSSNARRVAYTPGISWIGLGYVARSGPRAISRLLAEMGRHYLRGRTTFKVEAETTGGEATASDITGEANARILEENRGARISERRPEVRFRVAIDGQLAAAGVEIRRGVGGIPTSSSKAYCLVSGGMHSSVVAWMAALCGFSLELVHVKRSDESLLEAARLCSELSHRLDPRALRLTLLTGAKGSSTASVLSSWLRKGRSPVFSGDHLECAPHRRVRVDQRVLQPLQLFPESEFEATYASLGLRGFFEREGLFTEIQGAAPSRYRTNSFGGVRADVHEIYDSLKR